MRFAGIVVIAVIGIIARASADPAALVRLATAQSRALHPTVTGYGTVAPDPGALVTIALPRDGVIEALAVRVGQSVHAGDAIATVRTAPSASVTFAQAQSALALAEKDLAHTRELYQEQLATASQLATAEKAASDARATLDAQIKIGTGRDVETMRANAPGVVTAVSVSPGDRVQANATIASIAVRGRLIVSLGLEPQAAQEVTPGEAVLLKSPQRPALALTGTVQSVDAMLDPKSRLVNAVVAVPNATSKQLFLGMVLDATVSVAAKTGIAVPKSALMNDAGGTYVFVVKQDVARRHAVRVRFESGNDALLASGVAPGEQVVVGGNAGIDNGSRVRVR